MLENEKGRPQAVPASPLETTRFSDRPIAAVKFLAAETGGAADGISKGNQLMVRHGNHFSLRFASAPWIDIDKQYN
jgi:hypothetical protein